MTSFDIYNYATQKQIDLFKPTFLYIKRHKITGLLYFGKTIQKDPVKYTGSGTYWLNHSRKYGIEHIETIWYCLFTDIETLVESAINLSDIMSVQNSVDFANYIVESGISSGATGHKQSADSIEKRVLKTRGRKDTTETKRKKSEWIRTKELGEKISKSNTGRKVTEEQKLNMRNAQLGTKQSKETKEKRVENTRNGKGYGHTLDENTKKKISEKLKGTKRSKESILKGLETKRNNLKISSEEHIQEKLLNQNID